VPRGTVVIGFPWFMRVPSIHAVVSTPADPPDAFVAASPVALAFPARPLGRRPH